jgi:hypothetical protein
MSATQIQQAIADAKVAFIAAKSDGKLQAEEVVQIALLVGKKIHTIFGASLAEKEALVLLCLKKGLAAAGGMQGLEDPAAEKQVLAAALKTVKLMKEYVPQLFALPKGFFSCCSGLAAAGAALLPKDAAVIMEALQLVESFAPVAAAVPVEEVSAVATIQESAAGVSEAPAAVSAPAAVAEAPAAAVAVPAAAPAAPAAVPAAAEDTPPVSISDVAPSLVASPPVAPEPIHEVEFA